MTEPNDIKRVKEFLEINIPLFASSAEDLAAPCSVLEYHIETINEKPINLRPYGRSVFENDLLDRDVDIMLKANIVEPSNSPYAFQAFYVRKVDIDKVKQAAKTLAEKQLDRRLVINLVTIKDAFPPPVIKDIYNRLKSSVYFCTLDHTKGYWQIKLADDSKHKTAFRTRRGLFQFTRLPFGLVNASAVFQRVMYKVFGDLPFVETYIDDCAVHAKTIDLMFVYLNVVMERVKKYHLKINWKKCQWFRLKIKLLGQVISHDTIEMDKEKIRILIEWPIPKCVKSLQEFLGLANFNRNKIVMFARYAAPLYELLRKGVVWDWTMIRDEAFNAIKAKFKEFPFLRLPDLERPFILKPDACFVAVGYILAQKDDFGVEYMVEADSRLLTVSETVFNIYELEMLAYIFGAVKCRQYLDGRHFTCLTDHEALTWFDSIRHALSKHRLRWYLTAQAFDCTFVHRPGVLHSDADAVSRVWSHDISPDKFYLTKKDADFSFSSRFEGQNKQFNFLSKADVEPEPMKLRILSTPSKAEFNDMIARQMALLEKFSSSVDPWEDKNLLNYIRTGRHCDGLSKKQVTRVEFLSKRYVFTDKGLFFNQSTPDEPISLRPVPEISDRENLVRMAHYLGHFAVEKTLSLLRSKYYWPGMQRDVVFVINNCIACLKYKKFRPRDHPAMSLPILGINDRVSIDQVHGLPLTVRGFKGVNFLTEHVTGYATGHPIKGKTQEESGLHLWEHITRFGPPKELLSDMGKEWVNGVVASLTRLVGADHFVTSAYRPNTNGLQERGNSTLCEALRVFCSIDGNTADWDLKLPYILMAFNLMVNSSRKFSPHELMFARKMNFFEDYRASSAELEIPMLLKRAAVIRILNEDTLPKAIDNLLHAQVEQRKSSDKHHKVQVEPLVLGSKVMLWDPKIKGKLDVRKAGPYFISKVSPRKNYFLTNCRTHVALKNAVPLRRLEPVADSVTEYDESVTTHYDICKVKSVRGQEPDIEFLVEWKDKPRDRNTWTLERDLSSCPDQANTKKLIDQFRTSFRARVGTRQSSGLNTLSLLPLIALFLIFLPLMAATEIFGNFRLCNFNDKSPVVNYDFDCHLASTNPVLLPESFYNFRKKTPYHKWFWSCLLGRKNNKAFLAYVVFYP